MTVPNRMPPTPAGRAKNVATTHASLSGHGQTKAARPVVDNRRQAQVYHPPVPASPVTVGDTTGQDQSVAISLTTGSDSSSTATEFRAVAVGWGAGATGSNSTALGAQSFAGGASAVAVGSSALAEVDSSVAIGCGADAKGVPSVAIGSLDSGAGVHAFADGSVAIGADSSLTGAVALNENEFVLGTDQHIVIVNGKLVAGDGAGGLWQIVVSTGGALSTVAYP